jgi:pimeloyl-ACP methyl ester carboxylesterase
MEVTTEMSVEPFLLSVPEDDLKDLRARLSATRWPDAYGNEDWYYGVEVGYLKELVDYWIDGFDWRAAERAINACPQYLASIDDNPLHFLRVPGKGPSPVPLLLMHGWPWTFWDWKRVIGPLTDPAAHGGDAADAFDLVIPSMPGFAFSRPAPPDINFWKAGDLLHRLMTEILGYSSYFAAGSDMGSFATGHLGHRYAESVRGIFLARPVALDMFQNERPWDVSGGRMVPADAPDAFRDRMIALQRRFASHVAAHMLDAETLAVGLNDSPAGLLAWLLMRWRSWSDCGGDVESVFPRDHILTNTTIWWVTRAIQSSMRYYSNFHRYPWRPSHDRVPKVDVPAGCALLGFENPPGVTTATRVEAFLASPEGGWYDIRYAKAYEKGGHFAAFERPDAMIDGIRETFRPLR